MIFAFFNLGFGEIFAIFVVVLLLFGADKIPEFARSLGKGIRYVKDATESVKRDIQSSVDEVKKDIEPGVKEARENFKDLHTVQRKVKRQVRDIVDDVDKNITEVAKSVEEEKKEKSTNAPTGSTNTPETKNG